MVSTHTYNTKTTTKYKPIHRITTPIPQFPSPRSIRTSYRSCKVPYPDKYVCPTTPTHTSYSYYHMVLFPLTPTPHSYNPSHTHFSTILPAQKHFRFQKRDFRPSTLHIAENKPLLTTRPGRVLIPIHDLDIHATAGPGSTCMSTEHTMPCYIPHTHTQPTAAPPRSCHPPTQTQPSYQEQDRRRVVACREWRVGGLWAYVIFFVGRE